ncbi:MAG: hypothetical protein M0R75_03485 [Dehalococcoidia bacterium]|nr:hypothetical protein [Dehalococcoidia bacterium]
MTLRRITLAFAAAAVVGLLAAGSVAAAGIDLSPAGDFLAQQATATGTSAPSPSDSGNAGLIGQDGSSMPLVLGAALVFGVAALAGTGRWMMARRS